MERYNLLEGNSSIVTKSQRLELIALWQKGVCFMLREAQAAVLRPWQGNIMWQMLQKQMCNT